MNFLDAHMIVHRYSDALASHMPGKYDMIFRPFSDYGRDFDKRTIINAFKLFFAHMILFNTRTQQEFEQYKLTLRTLDSFISDEDMERVRRSCKILYDKSLIGRIRNASARVYAQEEIERFIQFATPPYSWSDEMDEFLTNIIAYKSEWLCEYQNIPKEKRNFWQSVGQYCSTAYRLAKISENSSDNFYFVPFDQLRADLSNPQCAEQLSPYREYILTSQ